MIVRNRTWLIGQSPDERVRQRTLPIEGGDGSTLSLDFTTGVLDPRLTFTRSTNATFINSSGLVQYADANYVQNSNDVTASGWTIQNGATRSFDNAVVNPEGGLGASLVTASSSIGSSAANTSPFTVNGGLTYTVSFWIRAGTATQALVGVYDLSIPPSGAFTPASALVISGPGSASGSSSIVVSGLTSSWTRVRIYLSPAYSGSRAVSIYPDAALASGKSIYIWGVKWEAGHVANPTQITTGATAYYAPRFDYDPTSIGTPRGLLIEGQAVNIMFRSQTMNTGPWGINPGSMTISETGSGSPANDATSNVVTWTNGTGAGSAWLQQGVTVSAGNLVVGTAYTWSVWLKSRGGRRVNVFASIQGVTGNREVRVDFGVSPPTVTSTVATGWTSIQTPTIVEYPNGWYKVTTGGTLPSGATSVNFGFSNSDAVPASGTNGFEAWGYQLEAGSGASSYIPTGASQGSRAADNCSIVSPNFAPWYGSPTGWTIVADMTPQSRAAGSFPGMLALRSAADSGLRIYYYNDGTYNTAFRFATASTGVEVYGPNGVTYGVPRKFGASVTSGTQFASSAGVQIGSTQTLAVPMDQTLLAIGSDGVSPTPAVNCRMHFRSIKYWPYAMTLAELNARTT